MRRWIVCASVAVSALACRKDPPPPPAPPPVPVLEPAAAPVSKDDAPSAALPAPLARSGAFRRGLVLGPLWAPDDDAAWKKAQLAVLDRAVERGVTDVELVVQWMQTSVSAVEIAPFESVHDTLLTWLIEQAKERKLRVLLAPRLSVEDQASWAVRGLKPSNWERWWWSYQRIALHYAKVAATRNVAMYAVGSELSSTEGQRDRWRKLIKAVRKIYKGKLTYFASADGFDKVPFWDALDVAGIAVDQAEPRGEAQSAGLLAELPKRIAKSPKVSEGYLISEASCGEGDRDDARELLCQRALFHNFNSETKLAGVFVSPAPAPLSRAPDIVRHWYARGNAVVEPEAESAANDVARISPAEAELPRKKHRHHRHRSRH